MTVTELPTAGRTTPTDRLRVLVVAESFLPQINGVTNSVRRVLEHLAEDGHEAELVAPTGPPSYAGFPITRARGAFLPLYKDFRVGLESRRRLRQVMLRFRPDVVHIASPATLGFQAVRVANELGIPTVAIYQTDMIGFARRYEERFRLTGMPGPSKAAAAFTRMIHVGVDRTLAPSTASLTQLDALAVPRTALWPRGVNLEQFHPSRADDALRAELAPNGEVIVGYIGRLAIEKELELLTAIADDPRYRLVLVGGGPDEAKLKALLPNAAFLGTLHGEQLGAAYASLDLFVHTGRHETFCQSAQEALASGLPVIAPRQGGPVDIVRDEVTGFLFEPGSRSELARYVELLATDDTLRRTMGRAARVSVADKSWKSINDRLVDHYRDVIAERAGMRRLSA
jgi:phosphatidylinositol alpha 1,6-mannosyltransferase